MVLATNFHQHTLLQIRTLVTYSLHISQRNGYENNEMKSKLEVECEFLYRKTVL